MGSKVLTDIENDLKLLITSLTGFEESDEGFQICERFVFSNIKHHRFLSINSHEVKRTIDEIEQKFNIYGKYNVAREFRSLVDNFLISFDFDHHPQYDLQWSLLCLLLNLSKDTTKSEVDCLHTTKIDKTVATNEEVYEIDWGEHLREGQEDFFCNYASSSESEWSGDEEKPRVFTEETAVGEKQDVAAAIDKHDGLPSKKDISGFKSAIDSRNWLDSNVENTWWNNLSSSEAKIGSSFPHAQLCRIYNKEVIQNPKPVGTITEYQACREVLWMFQVPMDMVIYKKKSESSFTVRDNISISSLTAPCFKSSFLAYCKYFDMIHRLNLFEKSLFKFYDTTNYPPLTLEAYNSAMKQYYHDIKQKIIEIERKVMRQRAINTYLTLSSDLEACLKRLELLDGVHRSVVESESEDLNWKKSYRLLTSIYREMENSSSRQRANICASLYLSSLRVYLNIIDTWLSEGRLEDFRNEFLISKVKENVHDQAFEHSWRMQFVIIENDDICPPDPIMKQLFRKVRDMGRSIELLVTLDRISDMWRLSSAMEASRIPLCDEFITRILNEVKKYRKKDESKSDEVDKPETEKADGQGGDKKFDELEDNIKQQVLRINNPFLMKVFQNYLPPISVDVVDFNVERKEENCIWGLNVFETLEKISPYALPFRKVMGDVLEQILNERYLCAAKLVKDILIKEYKLEMHLKLMRSIFMMERGHVMRKFYQQMFSDIENNLSVTNPESLTHLLEEVLSDEWRDSNSHNRWSIFLKDACTRQVLQAVDHVVLNYEIEWPINMVLTTDALKKYNDIFRFHLKLKWALWALNNLRFTDLEGKSSVYMRDIVHHFHTRRLESLRFWLLHAIGSIHSYLCGQVLQSLGLVLEEQLARADSLDAIMEAHNDYMDKVHEHCLQTPQFADIMVTINNLLGMCAHVRDRWERGARQLIASELDLMESSFTKYHTYLALALHNAVQHKEADYYTYPKNPVVRQLLAEVAYQSLPPSGIPLPISPFVKKKNEVWSELSSEKNNSREISLNEYDETFLHLWYQSIRNFFSISRLNLSESIISLKNKLF